MMSSPGSQPDSPPTDPQPKPDVVSDPPPSQDPQRIERIREQRREYEAARASLEPIVRDTAAQLDTTPLPPDCATLKGVLLEAYEKYDHTMQEFNRLTRELEEEVVTPFRPAALDRDCPVASKPVPLPTAPAPKPQPEKPSSERQLKALLAKFTQAYEDRDLEKLRSLTRMSDARLVNVETMFRNYSTFKLSVNRIRQEGTEAVAVLQIETAITPTGEAIDLPPIAKKLTLRISRQGDTWDKIIW